jgi:anti-sigma B factor antagonist
MDVYSRIVAGVAILSLEGRLITTSRPGLSLRAMVRDQISEGRLVVLIDMAGVTDIDAHGLGSLISSLTTLERHGGRMALVAPTERVRRLLAITRLDTVFEVYDTEREALVRHRPIVVPTAPAARWLESAVAIDGGTSSDVPTTPPEAAA